MIHCKTLSSLSLLCSLCVIPFVGGKELNLADPETHSYADSSAGREGYVLASQPVNKFRLYDFYQRQADFYLAHPEDVPEVLPAYPGLDGGKYGHWGKLHQNNHRDARWNEGEMGEVVTHVLKGKELTLLKGIALRLGEQRELSAAFDPLTLRYRAFWKDGFLSFDGHRWGTSRSAELSGEILLEEKEAAAPEDFSYLGFRRYGKRVVFSYQIQEALIRDEPWAVGEVFYRRLEIGKGSSGVVIPLPKGAEVTHEVMAQRDLVARIDEKKGELHLQVTKGPASAILATTFKKGASVENTKKAAAQHFAQKRVQTRRWTQSVTTVGTLGTPPKGSSYAVDTITVPFDNPFKTVMQLTSIALLPNGEALVATLPGDIWKVSGLDNELGKVTWMRFATGLNQPMGLHADKDGIFVLDRGQIYRLHDENKDGEADFYENYANDFGGYDRSHTHTFGLHRTADGSFHFTQRENVLRTGPDRKTIIQAKGVRNCMGIGGSDDYFWVAPQEGNWTPASAIIEIHDDEVYGYYNVRPGPEIAPPLCYIPRGVDNSTGGMVEITSDKWGPYKGSHVGLSYGSGLHYLILRDDQGSRPQGAVVPLEGEFLAGSMRGEFHPLDGQLYLVGLDGWGDYSTQDGCFHRVRYTGGISYKPSGFQVHRNGIRIDFSVALDAKTASDPSRYFAQSWNYEYARRYGSPEFSAKSPDSLGHDREVISSVQVMDGGRSIFVEMPAMEPVMQLQIRMHLTASDGHKFETDLFASPLFPSPAFEGANLAKIDSPPNAAVLRVAHGKKKQAAESGTAKEGERSLLVNAQGGLLYEQTLLEVKAGEPLALTLRNLDVMDHNLVIVKPGATQKVGDASFKMLNDPKAGEKNYVPNLSEVVAYIPVVAPKKKHILHFRAPSEPGDYPYICTYPGHWQVMQGILRVK